MIYKYYDKLTNQFVAYEIYGETLYDVYGLEGNSLIEFHIPKQINYHHTWKMYDCHDMLQMLYADPENKTYGTFNGVLYNKRTQTLLYVPRGKTSLHIPKHIKHIGFEALNSYKLKTISIDSDNPNFQLVDGNLYNNTMEILYFTPSNPKLFIASTVNHIHSSVLFQIFLDITVSVDNPIFKAVNGVLYEKNRVIYMCPNVRSVYLHSDADIPSFCKLDNIANLSEIKINENHPYFRAIDNVIYKKDCTELIYVSSHIQKIHLPNQLTFLKRAQFEKCMYLKEIYVHQNTRFNARSFEKLNDDCRIFVHMDEERTIELPRISISALAKCIQFLKGFGAEVKPETELFYLDYYLSGWDVSPNFSRVIQVSSWQIIKRVIEENHLSRMNKILSDGSLITRKNINKALKFAMQCENTDIYVLLSSYKQKIFMH